ncbi:MAG: hypothetical protein BWY91_01038 [bacterium ADurb.BinA028]|nr:MAG: hypothetical protein BWY91_01038 [bacterium ADurb.BinA028]
MLKTISDLPVLEPPVETRMRHPAGGFVYSVNLTPEHNRSVVIVFPSFSSLPPNPTHQQLAPGILLTTAWTLVKDAQGLPAGFRWLWGDEFAARVIGDAPAAAASAPAAEVEQLRAQVAALERKIATAVANLQ